MSWHIDYGNDVGPDDDFFFEWWDVTDDITSFRCNSEDEANRLLQQITGLPHYKSGEAWDLRSMPWVVVRTHDGCRAALGTSVILRSERIWVVAFLGHERDIDWPRYVFFEHTYKINQEAVQAMKDESYK